MCIPSHNRFSCAVDADVATSPGTVSTVSSTYGVYTLAGCYAAPSSGYLLDGKTTVSAGLTLASCASFCAGSPAFAVQNGECLVHVLRASPRPPSTLPFQTARLLLTLA